MRKYRVIIAKENTQFCSQLKDIMDGAGFFDVLCSMHDGSGAAAEIISLQPDVLLLDAILPNKDGLSILREIRDAGLTGTKIIMLSPFVNDGFISMVQSMGVPYVIRMPMEPSLVFDRIVDFALFEEEPKRWAEDEKRRTVLRMRSEVVTNYLHMLGVPVNLIGFKLLKLGICYALNNNGGRMKPMKEVYGYVAEKTGFTQKQVERNIRNALEVTWQRGNIDHQHELFGYTVYQLRGRPTNKEFINMIADKAAMHLRYR